MELDKVAKILQCFSKGTLNIIKALQSSLPAEERIYEANEICEALRESIDYFTDQIAIE